MRLLTVALLWACLSGPVLAGPATDELRQQQRTVTVEVPESLDNVFDFEAMTKAVLGSQWSGRTEAELAEFRPLLRLLVARIYNRTQLGPDYSIEYLGEEAVGDDIRVLTRATSSDVGHAVDVTFKMRRTPSGWRAIDYLTDDVSLVSSYRSQFTKIITAQGFAVLLEKMRQRASRAD